MRISGPLVSSSTAHSLPVIRLASRRLSSVSLWYSWLHRGRTGMMTTLKPRTNFPMHAPCGSCYHTLHTAGDPPVAARARRTRSSPAVAEVETRDAHALREQVAQLRHRARRWPQRTHHMRLRVSSGGPPHAFLSGVTAPSTQDKRDALYNWALRRGASRTFLGTTEHEGGSITEPWRKRARRQYCWSWRWRSSARRQATKRSLH